MSCFYRVLYYVYEKLPKKCHELKDIVDDLKQCLTEIEMPKKGGTRPLMESGTRFIAHKFLLWQDWLIGMELTLVT